MTYETLLDEADKENIYIMENARFESRAEGLINGDVIGINREVRSCKQRACVLAEELGHHYTTVGNILDQSDTSNRKQELHARVWGYNKLIGLTGIIECHRAGCLNRCEMAEHLDVTEDFLTDALEYYRSKYGLYKQIDNYLVFFEPLGVLELYK